MHTPMFPVSYLKSTDYQIAAHILAFFVTTYGICQALLFSPFFRAHALNSQGHLQTAIHQCM